MRKIVTAVICAALFTGQGAALAPAASARTRPVYYAPAWHAEVRPGTIVFGGDGPARAADGHTQGGGVGGAGGVR
jgi:hypothetical protein